MKIADYIYYHKATEKSRSPYVFVRVGKFSKVLSTARPERLESVLQTAVQLRNKFLIMDLADRLKELSARMSIVVKEENISQISQTIKIIQG